jgi:hypothetical protein
MKYGVLMYSAERILDFHVTAVEVRQVHDSVDTRELTRGR